MNPSRLLVLATLTASMSLAAVQGLWAAGEVEGELEALGISDRRGGGGQLVELPASLPFGKLKARFRTLAGSQSSILGHGWSLPAV